MPVPAAGMHMSLSIEIDLDGTDKFMQTLEVADIAAKCSCARQLANARNRQGAGAGLRIGVAVGRGGGGDILGRGFC